MLFDAGTLSTTLAQHKIYIYFKYNYMFGGYITQIYWDSQYILHVRHQEGGGGSDLVVNN